jgi:hypothetical protein
MLLAVDPGLHHCGVSYWDRGKLVRAELVKNPLSRPGDGAKCAGPMSWAVRDAWMQHRGAAGPPALAELVLELPQIYQGRGGVASDIIDLAAVVGAVASALGGSVQTFYRPRDWKGQVPKEIHHPRVIAALQPNEMSAVRLCQPASLMHNVWDAVGLGLAHLKMTGVRR